VYWDLLKVWDLGTIAGSRQMFFNMPIVVPVDFADGHYYWALAIGCGDRANMTEEDGVENRFYVLVDPEDGVTHTLGEGSVAELDYNYVTTGSDGNDYIDPTSGAMGWYMKLRPSEKVNVDANVRSGTLTFVTFEPTVGGGTGGEIVCRAGGIGRVYIVDLDNPIGEVIEGDPVLGNTTSDGDDESTNTQTGEGGEVVGVQPTPHVRSHVVTNWRQD
jgi:hypothetical protein